jgi:polysaccharide export outer membrane protein
MFNCRVLAFEILIALTMCLCAYADQDRQTEAAPKNTPLVPSDSIAVTGKRDTDPPALQTRNPLYRLRWGDTLELKFPITPEFDQTVTIQPDGYISLLQLSDVHVEGKTKSELLELLRTAYAKILHDPQINIKLLEFEKPYFVAGGEVGKPGRYDMRGDTTVAQAVNIAGGLTMNAKHSQVLVFRRVSDEWVRVIELDLKQMFGKGDLSEDLHLGPGDMVFVPKSRWGKLKEFMPRVNLIPYIRPQF